MVKLWILSHKNEKTYHTLDKIAERCRMRGMYVDIVFEEDVIMEMSEGGLGLYCKKERMDIPDIVFVRIDSDTMNIQFQITLLKQLELMGVKIINSISAIENAINKVWQFQILSKHKIPIPRTYSYSASELHALQSEIIKENLSFPIVVKSVHGNKGNKVFTMHTAQCITEMKHVLNHEVPYLFQEFIHESYGKDMRIIVIDGKVVFAMIRRSNNNCMQANLSQGGSGEIVLGRYPEAEELAIRIATIMGMDIAGVDLLFSNKHGFVCCEVNNNPMLSRPIYESYCLEDHIADMIHKKSLCEH